MNIENQHSLNKNKPTSAKKGLKIAAFIATILAVIGAAGYGGFYYGSQQPVKTSSATSSDNSSTGKDTKLADTFHTVLATGYPFSGGTKLTTALAVPNKLQAISTNSTIQDPGYTATLTNKFNEEMGRWEFGNPSIPNSMAGGLSLIHIGNDWLQETSPAPSPLVYGLLKDYSFTTPAKKAASISQLEKDTVDCTKDSSKGFIISKTINVCFAPYHIRHSVGVYQPQLNIKGFGVINNQKYIFTGWLAVYGNETLTEAEADTKATAFAAGQIPKETQELVKEYVDALKMTTITATAHQ